MEHETEHETREERHLRKYHKLLEIQRRYLEAGMDYEIPRQYIPRLLRPPQNVNERAPKAIPVRVAVALVEQAIRRGEGCPITTDPLEISTAAVTSCYHCFQHDALQRWLHDHTTCPVCKSACVATRCEN
jgi:hypothetical protein